VTDNSHSPRRRFIKHGPPGPEQASHCSGFDTRQLHAGQRPGPEIRGARVAVPIFQNDELRVPRIPGVGGRRTSTCRSYGNTYSRHHEPRTVAVFEERVANPRRRQRRGGVLPAGIAAAGGRRYSHCCNRADHRGLVGPRALRAGPSTSFKHLLRKMNVRG